MWTQDISRDYLASLNNSMPKRMEAVIKNNRDMTKYLSKLC
jgi:hypothetical protein